MKNKILIILVLISMLAMATPVAADAPSCNWGKLTSEEISEGFGQGKHASDPSGDGYGPGDADHRRAGLANVVGKGDLEATCILIDSLMNP
ncbi:MAG TPA: hypothetical protein VK851_04370 [Anaerolineales bacterium]|nr:hypothetical protein [Anaerolineales bacterium]